MVWSYSTFLISPPIEPQFCTYLCVFYCLKQLKSIRIVQIFRDAVLSTGVWLIYKEFTVLEKIDSPSSRIYLLVIFAQLRLGLHAQFFSSCWDLAWFGLIQVLCLLSWRVWVHMKGCPAVSWRNWFLVAIQHLWYFNSLCSLFNSDSCMLGEKCEIHMFHLWLSIPVAVSFSLYFYQSWVSVLTTMYYK